MHIADLLKEHHTTFSFEFFPPKSDEAAAQLFEEIRKLESLKPTFVSVTYGAGGSTRERTHNLVLRLKQQTTLDPIPHLTCVCHGREELRDIITRYAQAGVSNILALGGDLPKDRIGHDRGSDGFRYAAGLVSFIKEIGAAGVHSDSRGFGIGVAGFPEGHPGQPNRTMEMDYLKAKVDAGADYIVTQLFFHNDDFYDFRDRCDLAGIKVPILAGIMPVLSKANMESIPKLALGARYPAKLLRKLMKCANDDTMRKVGLDWATQQCRDLLDKQVRGIHFYTMNRATATVEIYRRLGATTSEELAELTEAARSS
jgi:methylenetetrahydrofolate reductase (NADPH)